MKDLLKLIKELRNRTGAGFLDVKKSLLATNNNLDKAIEWLRKKGIAKAVKKSGAIATEGIVNIVRDDLNVVIYELNCQTDFVAKNTKFLNLAKELETVLLKLDFSTIQEVLETKINQKTLSEQILEVSSILGEKIDLRRAKKITLENYVLGKYVHNNSKIGAIVLLEGGDEEIAKNVAMHVASMNPEYLDQEHVPHEKMQEIEQEVAKSEVLQNKPENIKKNIIGGMIRKALSDITLVDQEFVMEKMSVKNYLKSHNAKAIYMLRFEVGEGLEKKETSFVDEVKKQITK